MHQVTETTFRDMINRSIAFTHKALAFAREISPFNYVDLSMVPGNEHSPSNAVGVIAIVLTRMNENMRNQPLLDKDGNPVSPQTVSEFGYSYNLDSYRLTLFLPFFTINYAQGVQDLLNLLDDPETTDIKNMCSYMQTGAQRLRAGTLSTEMQNFDSVYWHQSKAPEAANDTNQIPELLCHTCYLSCYPRSIYMAQPHDQCHTDEPMWHLREKARLQYSQYDPLPATVADALDPDKIKALFPHLPVKPGHAGMIAYTQSATHGVMDRQTVTRAGRFIRQYAKDGTCDETVKQLAAEVASHLGSQFKHSKAREDYARIYIDGPSSCMSYDETGKEFGRLLVNGVFVHPCEVYAHPENDLEIVWCEVNDNVVARTIINKARMQYPRIYAKESVSNADKRLRDYLEDLGYRQHDSALRDQKLLRISPTKHPHAIICPYIDSSNLGVDVYNDHLITGGSESADHETGCLNDYNSKSDNDWTCDCCGDEFSDDDSSYEDYAGDYICEDCRDSDYVRAFCTQPQEQRYARDDSDWLYTLVNVNRGTLRHYSRIYTHGRSDALSDWDLVELDTSYYDSNSVALADDCMRTSSGEYVLTDDLSDHDLFYNEDEGEACEVSDWVVCVSPEGQPELTQRDDLDESEYEHAPAERDGTYPMLDVFTFIEQADQDEEAA